MCLTSVLCVLDVIDFLAIRKPSALTFYFWITTKVSSDLTCYKHFFNVINLSNYSSFKCNEIYPI